MLIDKWPDKSPIPHKDTKYANFTEVIFNKDALF